MFSRMILAVNDDTSSKKVRTDTTKGANAMLIKGQIVLGVLVCFALGFSSLSFAEDKAQPTTGTSASKGAVMSTMSPELRKDMANMYQKMADCLRTGKSSEDCQKQVAKDCPVIAKTGQCPILDGMGRKMGPRGMRPEGMGPMTFPHKMH